MASSCGHLGFMVLYRHFRPSLVHKVRFVASTLLDAVRKAETAPASAARAHAYLCALSRSTSVYLVVLTPLGRTGDFLSILSEIERNYLLDDERDDVGSSVDGGSLRES
jgi:hypothetical protein